MSRWAALHAALSRADRRRLLRRAIAHWMIFCGSAGLVYWTPAILAMLEPWLRVIQETVVPFDLLVGVLGAAALGLVSFGSLMGGLANLAALIISFLVPDDRS